MSNTNSECSDDFELPNVETINISESNDQSEEEIEYISEDDSFELPNVETINISESNDQSEEEIEYISEDDSFGLEYEEDFELEYGEDYTNNIAVTVLPESSTNKTSFLNFQAVLYSKNLEAIIEYITNNMTEVELSSYMNKCEYNNLYPVHYLCINENLTIEYLEYFKNKGMKFKYDDENISIIYYLFKYYKTNTLEIFKYLEKNGFEFNFRDKTKNSIIHYLILFKISDIELIEYVFSKVTLKDINDKNEYSIAPLLLSTQVNNDIITNKLLDFEDCDLDTNNQNDNAPMMYACMNNNFNIVKKLLEKGANLHAIDKQQDIPFFYACGCDNLNKLNLELVKYIYENNADIKQLSIDNYNCLHYASGINNNNVHLDVVNYLLDIGADPNVLSNDGETFIDVILANTQNKQDVEDDLIEIINKHDLTKHNNINNNLIVQFGNNAKFKDIFKFKNFDVSLDQNNSVCIICKDKFVKESVIVKCVNNHYFDFDCIIEWYNQDSNKSCPFCFKRINIYELGHI